MGEVCQINGRIGFRGYTEKDIIPKEQGGVLAFTPTNIVNNQLALNVKNTYITRAKYDESPEIMVKNGNILFVKTGSTLGKSALVKTAFWRVKRSSRKKAQDSCKNKFRMAYKAGSRV